MKIAIIGYGYWGPNLVRNFSSVDACTVAMVADLRTERFKSLNKTYPAIKTTASVNDVIDNTEIDAIAIATPVFLHFKLAKEALLKGKHVLIEKPMTATSNEAKELIEIAQKNKKVLMVDHTFLYTGAVQKMKELIDSKTIGKIKYFDSTRINLGLFQPDVNVIWDLAPHDISILSHLVKDKPYSVNATGISHTNNQIENIAYLTVNYQSDIIAHFNCSWTSPVKIRQILIGGDKKMILFDDVEPSEKVKIYDTGYTMSTDEDKRRILVDYRAGDIYVPQLSRKEALLGMATDFVNAITKGTEPISNWQSGLEVVKVLEASQKSIKQNGSAVILN